MEETSRRVAEAPGDAKEAPSRAKEASRRVADAPGDATEASRETRRVGEATAEKKVDKNRKGNKTRRAVLEAKENVANGRDECQTNLSVKVWKAGDIHVVVHVGSMRQVVVSTTAAAEHPYRRTEPAAHHQLVIGFCCER